MATTQGFPTTLQMTQAFANTGKSRSSRLFPSRAVGVGALIAQREVARTFSRNLPVDEAQLSPAAEQQKPLGFAPPLPRDETAGMPGMAYGTNARALTIRGAGLQAENQQPTASEQSQVLHPGESIGATEESREAPAPAEKGADGQPLSEAELREVKQLQQRDQEVRRHEQAHRASAGGLSSGSASYESQTGPDGKRYAVGGEVSIDVSSESAPDATLRKMERVRAAALAPANPSPQDRRVAAMASRRASEARQQMVEEQQEQGEQATADANRPDAASENSLPAAGVETQSKEDDGGPLSTRPTQPVADKGFINNTDDQNDTTAARQASLTGLPGSEGQANTANII